MAKPYGLGSFRIKVESLRCSEGRRSRYEALFASERELCTAAEERLDLMAACRKYFVEWYLNENTREIDDFEAELWQQPRLAELGALLTWRELTGDEQQAWLNRTRYLGFGSIRDYPQKNGIPTPYNEYQKVGYPGSPRPGIRRPLPPASQVLLCGPEIPSDPSPPWLSPAELREIKRNQQRRGPDERPNQRRGR